tara:strand:+ start:221 stop:685 length:465 start_codon:yes stop_codon:yes gene_type:complete
MMDNMRGQMGPTEEEIMELMKTPEGKLIVEQMMAAGNPGELVERNIGSPEVPLEQFPEDITLPPEPNEDITQPQTIDELSGSVPQDVSNMSPYGSLQGAESVGADETHTMPDGTVHPYSTHEEMMAALLRKQGIGGAELVGADPRGTRLGRGQY